MDSLLVSGIQWTLKTIATAAESELNDDTALRERLLEAEMRRETGEISDDEFAELEADLLARIRDIKERREGMGPLAFGAAEATDEAAGTRIEVEASVSGDFHDEAPRAHVESAPAAGDGPAVVSSRSRGGRPPSRKTHRRRRKT